MDLKKEFSENYDWYLYNLFDKKDAQGQERRCFLDKIVSREDEYEFDVVDPDDRVLPRLQRLNFAE